MKRIIIISALMLLIPLSNVLASDTIKANNPLLEYTGRIDFSNPLAPKFSYSGVSVRANFQGTSITIMLNDEDVSNFYNIILDNIIVKRLQVSKGLTTYPIASNLADTVHEIEIFKLTEADPSFGKTSFNGFLVDKGKTLVDITNQRSHLIEYVGNSITCGYGNEGLNGGTFGPTTENHYLTYAAFTSRNFNARHLAVCRSGIGIYRNYGDITAGSTECMTNDYSRIFLYDANPIYNFKLKPDLICVDLGTNDFSVSSNGFKGDSAKYVSKYFSFIDTLQFRNKGADILLLLGPMLGDPELSKIRRYLKFIVESANNKNKGKLYFFEMSQQTGDLGIAIDYHPTVAQHLRNGLELSKYIRQIKGWKVNPLLVKASVLKVNEVIINFNTEVFDTQKSFNGFSLIADSKTLKIKQVYLDTTDHSSLHVILNDNIAISQLVSISYKPASINSSDSIKLGAILSFTVTNNLTETKVTRVYSDVSGSSIYFSFNKSINKPQNISGIIIRDKNSKVFLIDSFKYSSKSIQVFLKSVISNSDTIYVTLPAIVSGQDGVMVTPVSNFQISNFSTVGIAIKKNELEGLEIFPNPSSQQIINYKISESISGNIFAELYDMQGKLLVNQKLQGTEGILDLRNYNLIKSKTYILKITNSNKAFQKLILL